MPTSEIVTKDTRPRCNREIGSIDDGWRQCDRPAVVRSDRELSSGGMNAQLRQDIAARLRWIRRQLRRYPNCSISRALLREWKTQARIAQYFKHTR